DRAGVRADPGPGLPEWELADFEELLDQARSFRRVGAGALPEPALLLREIVAGLFGAHADAGGGRFALSPWVVPGWGSMALRRLRCHRTLLDVELRPRSGWATVRLELKFGPAIALELSLRHSAAVARITVDEVPLEGQRAIFTLQGQHEVVFFFAGEPA
ncbi:MAG TPA: hypothetical protein VGP61_06390, partial [Gemmatimonadales bacterium]|nr:hypothetical protein [Gemmatimonadales bacterium]